MASAVTKSSYTLNEEAEYKRGVAGTTTVRKNGGRYV